MSETGQDIKKSIKYLSDRKQREKQRIFNNLFDINKKQHQLKNDPHRKRQVWKPDEHDAQHFVITGNGYCAMSGKNTTLFEYIKTAKFKSNNKKAKEYICTFEKFLRLKTGYSTDTGIDNERNYSTCAEPMAIVRALKNGVEPQDIEFKSIVKLSKLSEGQKTPCVDYCSEYILIGQDKKYHLDWDVVTDFWSVNTISYLD